MTPEDVAAIRADMAEGYRRVRYDTVLALCDALEAAYARLKKVENLYRYAPPNAKYVTLESLRNAALEGN